MQTQERRKPGQCWGVQPGKCRLLKVKWKTEVECNWGQIIFWDYLCYKSFDQVLLRGHQGAFWKIDVSVFESEQLLTFLVRSSPKSLWSALDTSLWINPLFNLWMIITRQSHNIDMCVYCFFRKGSRSFGVSCVQRCYRHHAFFKKAQTATGINRDTSNTFMFPMLALPTASVWV